MWRGAYLWKGIITGHGDERVKLITVRITVHAHDCPDFTMEQSNITLPPRLNFFSLEGEDVLDMGWRAYVSGRVKPVKSMLATEASDYAFTKYTSTNAKIQQRNDMGKTYSDVVNLVERPLRRTSPARRSAGMSLGVNRDDLEHQLDRVLNPDQPVDIITISASGLGRLFGGGDVKLSTLLRDLHETGNDYADVLCGFC